MGETGGGQIAGLKNGGVEFKDDGKAEPLEVVGCGQRLVRCRVVIHQAWLLPQPQAAVALGFLKTKPAPMVSSL